MERGLPVDERAQGVPSQIERDRHHLALALSSLPAWLPDEADLHLGPGREGAASDRGGGRDGSHGSACAWPIRWMATPLIVYRTRHHQGSVER